MAYFFRLHCNVFLHKDITTFVGMDRHSEVTRKSHINVQSALKLQYHTLVTTNQLQYKPSL
jgi:hypothetical protein